MPSTRQPRSGSMQYWPRKRARSQTVRVRSWADSKKTGPLGFAGYKAGMTHAIVTDTRKNSVTKGAKLRVPVTVVECPNLKVIGVRFYKKTLFGHKVATEIEFKHNHKRLSRRKSVPKKGQDGNLEQFAERLAEFSDIRLMVHTLPDMTGVGKKTPEVFELGLGGTIEDKFNYAKENKSNELTVADIFEPGEQLDIKSVTIGKGLQGPVKRFGVHIRSSKSEKTKRGPGSISGGWTSAGHMMYRVPDAGQTGYHTRTEYNKILMKSPVEPDEVNPEGGFINYGLVKNSCVLIKGSIPGPKKRIIRFNRAIRPNALFSGYTPAIDSISKRSKQGN
ncbi:MAG: 50S ribosomal protein L3 [Candidatus Woesearchaeota archaeon]